jgi:hypothetical protein
MGIGKSKYFVKNLTACFILLFGSLIINGQDTIKVNSTKNSIYLDFATLKFIGMSSINYERTIFLSEHFKMLGNTGLGGWYLTSITKWYYGYSLPLCLNSLIGKNNNYLEFDLGMRYTYFGERSDKDLSPFFPILNLGYRYQRSNGKGMIFRSFVGTSGFGIGLGKSF